MATDFKSEETYYLVRWLDDDELGVIPESYFRPGADLSIGSCTRAARKYSKVQIINISDNRQTLNRTVTDLFNESTASDDELLSEQSHKDMPMEHPLSTSITTMESSNIKRSSNEGLKCIRKRPWNDSEAMEKRHCPDFSTAAQNVSSCMETLEKKLSQHERLIAELLKEKKTNTQTFDLVNNSETDTSHGHNQSKLKVANDSTSWTSDIISKTPESEVELMHGHGVWLTQRQLDKAITTSLMSPTKLTRKLLSIFFSSEVLGNSSAYGTGRHPALDKDIICAIISFVKSRHDVAKSVLVDAINDKCANSRRKKKKDFNTTITS